MESGSADMLSIMPQKLPDNRMTFRVDGVRFLTVAIRSAGCGGLNPGLHWREALEIAEISGFEVMLQFFIGKW